jgi:hypothetical protein
MFILSVNGWFHIVFVIYIFKTIEQ